MLSLSPGTVTFQCDKLAASGLILRERRTVVAAGSAAPPEERGNRSRVYSAAPAATLPKVYPPLAH